MLQDALDVVAEMKPGSGGIFEVAVNGAVVAKKTLAGFPTDTEIIDAVAKALPR